MNTTDAPVPPSAAAAGSPMIASAIARVEMNETFYQKLEAMFPVEPMTADQVATMNHHLGHPKDASYRPYCMHRACGAMPRMFRVAQGFKCWNCNNMIGFDLRRIESENAERSQKQGALDSATPPTTPP